MIYTCVYITASLSSVHTHTLGDSGAGAFSVCETAIYDFPPKEHAQKMYVLLAEIEMELI